MKKFLFLASIACLLFVHIIYAQDSANLKIKIKNPFKSTNTFEFYGFDKSSKESSTVGKLLYEHEAKNFSLSEEFEAGGPNEGATIALGHKIAIKKWLEVTPGFGISMHSKFSPLLDIKVQSMFGPVRIVSHNQVDDGFSHFGYVEIKVLPHIYVGGLYQILSYENENKLDKTDVHQAHMSEAGPQLGIKVKNWSFNVGELFGSRYEDKFVSNGMESLLIKDKFFHQKRGNVRIGFNF